MELFVRLRIYRSNRGTLRLASLFLFRASALYPARTTDRNRASFGAWAINLQTSDPVLSSVRKNSVDGEAKAGLVP